MSPQSKREYLKAIYWRYRRASRRAKSIILDEFCQTCRYHRKHAIRLLRRFRPFLNLIPENVPFAQTDRETTSHRQRKAS